jgi:hypothetical protein
VRSYLSTATKWGLTALLRCCVVGRGWALRVLSLDSEGEFDESFGYPVP